MVSEIRLFYRDAKYVICLSKLSDIIVDPKNKETPSSPGRFGFRTGNPECPINSKLYKGSRGAHSHRTQSFFSGSI